MRTPYVVAIGGTLRPGSSTEKALRCVLKNLERRGARTRMLTGTDLMMPIYSPHETSLTPSARQVIDEVRAADALVLGTPGYHGGISGMVKNVIDYLEELKGDSRCYLAGMPVGCVVTAAGDQAAVSTLGSLRCVVHALRGWPTPLGATINTTERVFSEDGDCLNPSIVERLEIMSGEIMDFLAPGCEHRLRGAALSSL